MFANVRSDGEVFAGACLQLGVPADFINDKEPYSRWQTKSYISSHFFCQSYCGKRRPAQLAAINSLSRLARVWGLFAPVTQPSALRR